MLTFFSTPPASLQRAQLSYHVGYVDLTSAVVTAGTTSVQVQLVNDGSSGKVFWHPSHLNAIPASGTEQNDLDWAMQWAQERWMLDDVQPLLDRDGDGCANLVEACDGVLYDDTDVYSPGPPPTGTCSTPNP